MLRATFIPIALSVLLLAVVARSQKAPGTLAVADIRPGMKGYGLSVFRGQTPERFEAEVIDVLHKFRPDQDLILVRTRHPVLERAITVGGMSGSPVYVDGKLIGAYAYGWTFGKEPVIGVTPIANMLAELARPVDPRIWRALGTLPQPAAQRAAPRGPQARRAWDQSVLHADAFSVLRSHAARHGYDEAREQAGPRLARASTPLLVSGMTDATVSMLARELDRFGLTTLQAGGGSKPAAAGAAAAHFVDGGAIGVQLIRGDISATAIGTVTHVGGERLVAFGHPMLNAGQVGLPTCTANVLHILSSQMRSFKIAEAVTPLGTLIHDRQAAIVIDPRLRADTIPVTLRIHGAPGAQRTRWNVEVGSHRLLTPGLVFSALYNALSATVADASDLVYQVDSKVTLDGHGTTVTRDVGYSMAGAADPSTLSRARLFSVLSAAYGNPFEDVRITRVELDLSLRFERDVLDIVDAQVASEEVDPGKPMNVYVTLRRFDRSEDVRVVALPIPMSAAGESVEIAIEAGDDVRLDQPKPDSLGDLLRAVASGYQATSIVLSARLPAQGVKLRGRIVSSLPGSALDSLQPVNESDRGATFPTYARTELPLGHVVTGSARVKVNVRREPLR